jgi:hypothetical protein
VFFLADPADKTGTGNFFSFAGFQPETRFSDAPASGNGGKEGPFLGGFEPAVNDVKLRASSIKFHNGEQIICSQIICQWIIFQTMGSLIHWWICETSFAALKGNRK